MWLIVELLFKPMSLKEKASLWEVLQASYTHRMLEVLLGMDSIKLLNNGDEAHGLDRNITSYSWIPTVLLSKNRLSYSFLIFSILLQVSKAFSFQKCSHTSAFT